MSPRQTAVEFLRLASAGRTGEAYRLVDKSFVHHNPYFQGTAKALKAGMDDAHRTDPNKSFEVLHTLRDGDFVAVHSRVTKAKATIAVVHLFRFEAGRIAELWDIGAVVPAESPNENGMF